MSAVPIVCFGAQCCLLAASAAVRQRGSGEIVRSSDSLPTICHRFWPGCRRASVDTMNVREENAEGNAAPFWSQPVCGCVLQSGAVLPSGLLEKCPAKRNYEMIISPIGRPVALKNTHQHGNTSGMCRKPSAQYKTGQPATVQDRSPRNAFSGRVWNAIHGCFPLSDNP